MATWAMPMSEGPRPLERQRRHRGRLGYGSDGMMGRRRSGLREGSQEGRPDCREQGDAALPCWTAAVAA